jgi:hypothetical protein
MQYTTMRKTKKDRIKDFSKSLGKDISGSIITSIVMGLCKLLFRDVLYIFRF